MAGSSKDTSQATAPPVILRRSARVAEASQKVFIDGDEGPSKRLRRHSLPAQTRIKTTQKQNAKMLKKVPD